MTPLYAGIGGVVRELTEMDAGINGVVTPMTEMWAGVGGVERQIFSAVTTAGDLAVGDIVQLNENGVAQDYLCIHQGLPSSLYDSSCDGTWLLRKDIIEEREWSVRELNAYAGSEINIWLNSTMLGMYDTNVRSAIKQVKIPYVNGAGNSAVASGSSGLPCKIFFLSGREVGFSASDSQYFPNDGAKLSYFESGTGSSANNKRIAKLNGSAAFHWLRSPRTNSTASVWGVRSNGIYDFYNCSYSRGIRPAFVLSSNFLI